MSGYVDQYVVEALRAERGEIADLLMDWASAAEIARSPAMAARLYQAAEVVRLRGRGESELRQLTDPEHAAAVRAALAGLTAAMRAAKDAGLSVLISYMMSNPMTVKLEHFTAEDVENRMTADVTRTVVL